MVSQRRVNESALIKRRMEVVFLLFLGFVVLLGLRLAYLQGFQSKRFLQLANRMAGRTVALDAERGAIRDRNGVELATDVLAKSIAINPRAVKDPALTAARLAELLRLDETQRAALQQAIVDGKAKKSAYRLLRRGVDRKLAEQVKALGEKEAALKHVSLEDYPVRVNPCGADGVQLVGPVSSDGQGIEGIELKFNSVLAGKNGKRRMRVDGNQLAIPESEVEVETAVDGRDVTLTLDRNIQHFVEEELAQVAAEQSPDAATAIVMDVRSGDVLAMANWPSYDPAEKKPVKPEQRRNRAVTDLFEPGSTFKVITAAAALEAGVKTSVYCSGRRAIGRRSVRCAHGASHGPTDLRRMIEQSCNLAAGALSERVGPTGMYAFLDKMGLMSKTGIEFPGEEYGRLPDPAKHPEKWPTMRTVNIGFGQGVVTSPLQLVSAYAAIANDGMYQPPRLVLNASGAELPAREPRRVMSAANAASLRSYMEAVVTDGTGKKAKIAGYSVAGKTGTAQIAKNGRYGHGYLASFVGFLPASKPRLAILVSVWHPRHGQYGGVVSAPVFREIARQSVSYLKIAPDTPNDLRDGAGREVSDRYARSGQGQVND